MSQNDPQGREEFDAARDTLNEGRPTTLAEAQAQLQEIKIILRGVLRALASGRF